MTDSIADAGVEEANETEQETIEEPETLPEPGTDEAEAAEQDPEEDEEEAGTDEDPEGYEEIEFDFGGNKFAIDKTKPVEEVAGELQGYAKSLEAGFTQKTQALAEQRKSLEAQTEAIQELSTLNGEAFELYTTATSYQKELSQYDSLPWAELWETEPDKARELSDKKNWLQNEFQGLKQQFQQKTQALHQTQSQQRDRFMAEGRRQIEKKIPGFESKAAEVVDYVVKTYGVARERAEEWPLNPPGTEMAYKAMQYDKVNKNLKTAKNPRIKPAVPIPPIKSNSGTGGTKPLHEMNMDQYVKARKAGKG